MMKFLLRQAAEGKNSKKKKTAGAVLLVISILILVHAWSTRSRYTPYEPGEETKISLYGEVPGVEHYYEKEYELWEEKYSEEGLRDLFLGLPYYEAEWLNLWMAEGDEEMLEQWYGDIEGTLAHVEPIMDFYRKIRENCPETVFHGTDVGLRYDSSGARYLKKLEERGETDTEAYRLAEECIEQGKVWEEEKDADYREKTLAENFIRAYDQLENDHVMGIYADAHCDPRKNAAKGKEPCMAARLQEQYGDVISYEAVEYMVKIESDKMLERKPAGKKERLEAGMPATEM